MMDRIILRSTLLGEYTDMKLRAFCSIAACRLCRKLLRLLQPKAAVVCVAAGRPDERPHPYIVSLLKEFTEDVHFTDAVEIPGLVEPVFHTSVHIELP